MVFIIYFIGYIASYYTIRYEHVKIHHNEWNWQTISVAAFVSIFSWLVCGTLAKYIFIFVFKKICKYLKRIKEEWPEPPKWL